MGMFADAKVIEAKPASKKKKEKEFVETEGLNLFAALKAVEKNVKAQLSVVEAGVKNTMMGRFIEEGMRLGRKPDSYDGVDEGSTGNLQLRTRVATSGLSPEEVELLKEHNIPMSENIAVQEAFVINPAYTNDMDMLAKVEEALSGLGLPADFIQKQEKSFKTIATDKSIDAVCKLKDKATVAALMPVVTTLAIRPKLADGANPFEIVEEALGEPETA